MTYQIRKRLPFGPLFQGLVADPEAKHYHRMKNSVWLFLYLIAFSNLRSGKLIARLSDVAADVGLSEDTLSSWIGHLRKWHYIDVENQGDALLFKIMKWQNITAEIDNTAPTVGRQRKSDTKTALPTSTAQELPLNYNASQLATYISNLLSESTYQAAFESLCRHYPRAIIQRALTETRAVPDDQIKKSRGALFIYLVKKYAQKEKSTLGN